MAFETALPPPSPRWPYDVRWPVEDPTNRRSAQTVGIADADWDPPTQETIAGALSVSSVTTGGSSQVWSSQDGQAIVSYRGSAGPIGNAIGFPWWSFPIDQLTSQLEASCRVAIFDLWLESNGGGGASTERDGAFFFPLFQAATPNPFTAWPTVGAGSLGGIVLYNDADVSWRIKGYANASVELSDVDTGVAPGGGLALFRFEFLAASQDDDAALTVYANGTRIIDGARFDDVSYPRLDSLAAEALTWGLAVESNSLARIRHRGRARFGPYLADGSPVGPEPW